MTDWRLLALALAFVYAMARMEKVNRRAMKFAGLLVLALAGYKTVPMIAAGLAEQAGPAQYSGSESLGPGVGIPGGRASRGRPGMPGTASVPGPPNTPTIDVIVDDTSTWRVTFTAFVGSGADTQDSISVTVLRSGAADTLFHAVSGVQIADTISDNTDLKADTTYRVLGRQKGAQGLWSAADTLSVLNTVSAGTKYFECDWDEVGTTEAKAKACAGAYTWPSATQFGMTWDSPVEAAPASGNCSTSPPTTNVWVVPNASSDMLDITGSGDNIVPDAAIEVGDTLAWRWYECYFQDIPAAQAGGTQHGEYDGTGNNPGPLTAPNMIICRSRINDTSHSTLLAPSQSCPTGATTLATQTVGVWNRIEYRVIIEDDSPCEYTLQGRFYSIAGALLAETTADTDVPCEAPDGLTAFQAYHLSINGCTGCDSGHFKYYAAFAIGDDWLGPY